MPSKPNAMTHLCDCGRLVLNIYPRCVVCLLRDKNAARRAGLQLPRRRQS
jgi:hypothetical protein